MKRLDGALAVSGGLAALWLSYLLVREGLGSGWRLVLVGVFWVLVTYLVLPRLHRTLTRLYVPGYFIGRTRTSDGLLGDPVNLALRGQEAQVHQALVRGGWSRADDLTLGSGLQAVRSALARGRYPTAPVSPLLLFDRQQDFAYQQEVPGRPWARHHVRFWRAPGGWKLPGGHAVDWLAAGTYDRSVGLSLFTLQVTHKIDADTDLERDHVLRSVAGVGADVVVEVIRGFSTGYHSRNGGGDHIRTDGDLPVLDVGRVAVPTSSASAPSESRHRRPAQLVVGAGLAFLRGAVLLVAGLGLIVGSPDDLAGMLVLGAGVADLGLAPAALQGRSWARILLLLTSVLFVVAAFVDNALHPELITLARLPTVALSILVLLALSSDRARDYAALPRWNPGPSSRRYATCSRSR